MLHRALLAFVLMLGVAPSTHTANAQAYPSKPITVMVPYAAGGGGDTLTRAWAKKLSEAWGQPIVVENRPGGDGVIGSAVTARSPADGYHLVAVSTAHVINGSLKSKLPFDLLKDFAPVTLLASSSWTLAVNPQVPATNLAELIALAKARPNELSIGISDPQSRLAAELLMKRANIKLTIVPYKGGSQMLTDLLGGHLQIGLATIPSVFNFYKAGTLRLLAVAGKQRASSMPNVPTTAEAGLPDYEVTVWYGVYAPAGTPKEILNKIQKDLAGVWTQPDMREHLANISAEAINSTPDEFDAFTRSEYDKYARIVKDAGIQPD